MTRAVLSVCHKSGHFRLLPVSDAYAESREARARAHREQREAEDRIAFGADDSRSISLGHGCRQIGRAGGA
jgi:hypothetical protein